MQSRSRVQGAWSGGQSNGPAQNRGGAAAPKYQHQNAPKKDHIILQPGMVYFPFAIDSETQKWLVDVCLDVGRSKTEGEGFYSQQDGGSMVLNQGTRGRVIKTADQFPNRLPDLCTSFVEKARAIDPSIPPMTPNTILINYYNEKAHFKWHKDSEDPALIKGHQGKPIVSISVGLSGNFCYKARHDDVDHKTIRLNSGDVLIFGGPSRMIVHSVDSIVSKTMPAPLIGKLHSGRLNLTIRDIGRGRVDYSQAPAYRVVYDDAPSETND